MPYDVLAGLAGSLAAGCVALIVVVVAFGRHGEALAKSLTDANDELRRLNAYAGKLEADLKACAARRDELFREAYGERQRAAVAENRAAAESARADENARRLSWLAHVVEQQESDTYCIDSAVRSLIGFIDAVKGGVCGGVPVTPAGPETETED